MSDKPTLLMPEWKEEDFYESGVYAWLWEHRDDGFLFQQCLAKTARRAKELKIIGFTRMYNAYVQAMNPKASSVLGINATEFPDQPAQLRCGRYQCDENGIRYEGRMGEEITVCSHPILPVQRIVNIDTNEENLQIAYSRGRGKWRTLITGRETLASAQKIIGLAKNGVAVNSENAKELVKYITDLESENYDDLPAQNSTSHLGWLPDRDFAPYCKEVVYDGESPEHERMYRAFQECGSYDAWLQIARDARAGESVPARIALAGAFAAPLIQPMGALPFILHFYGTTGMGKSVGTMLSASVWAEPTIGGAYVKTFGGTKVSQELTAAFCCNVPMYIDELQIISDRKSFDDIIYMLCEGSSKGRGAKEGGLQLQKRWNNCIITNGEIPIVQGNSGGGAAVRTIEVNYGGVPFFPDSRAVANALKENYGFAGRRFVDALKDDDTMMALKELQKTYYGKLSGDIHGKQVLSASILLAADKLADAVIFQDGKSLTVEDIKPYLITNEQADANARCYNWLLGYIGANPARFKTEENNGELWGVIEQNVAYIIRSIFDRIVQSEGYSPGTFLGWAKRNRKIVCEQYGPGAGKNRLTRRKTINGHSLVCVALILDEDNGYVEVDEEGLPF